MQEMSRQNTRISLVYGGRLEIIIIINLVFRKNDSIQKQRCRADFESIVFPGLRPTVLTRGPR